MTWTQSVMLCKLPKWPKRGFCKPCMIASIHTSHNPVWGAYVPINPGNPHSFFRDRGVPPCNEYCPICATAPKKHPD